MRCPTAVCFDVRTLVPSRSTFQYSVGPSISLPGSARLGLLICCATPVRTWVDGVRPASCYPVMCKAVGVPNHYMCGVVRHSGVWCLLRVLGLERCPSRRPLLTSKDAIEPTTHLFLGAGLLNRADTGTPRSGPLDLTHEPNYHRYTLRYTTLYSGYTPCSASARTRWS